MSDLISSEYIDQLRSEVCEAMGRENKARKDGDSIKLRIAEADTQRAIARLVSAESDYAEKNDLVWFRDRYVEKEWYDSINWDL